MENIIPFYQTVNLYWLTDNRKFKKGWSFMSSLLSYRNYNGTVEYSKEDKCLFGKVIGIKSLLSYEGTSVKEPKENFINVIDGYLADCKERPNLNSLIRAHLISE